MTPESGEQQEMVYTITVYRTRIAPSADASLSDLAVGGVTPPFSLTAEEDAPIGRMHNATALTGTGSVTVTAEATADRMGRLLTSILLPQLT